MTEEGKEEERLAKQNNNYNQELREVIGAGADINFDHLHNRVMSLSSTLEQNVTSREDNHLAENLNDARVQLIDYSLGQNYITEKQATSFIEEAQDLSSNQQNLTNSMAKTNTIEVMRKDKDK